MIPKFEIVHEFEIVQEVPGLETSETPCFKTIRENNIIRHIDKINVSEYRKIKLINAREVSSNPNFKYAIALPLFGGLIYLYPNEISNRKYYLNEKETNVVSCFACDCLTYYSRSFVTDRKHVAS